MIQPITGPTLRRRIEAATDAVVRYTYVDGRNKRMPEYAATHLRMNVYYIFMGTPLAPLLATLTDITGFEEAEIVMDHPTLRPQIIAVFNRLEREP